MRSGGRWRSTAVCVATAIIGVGRRPRAPRCLSAGCPAQIASIFCGAIEVRIGMVRNARWMSWLKRADCEGTPPPTRLIRRLVPVSMQHRSGARARAAPRRRRASAPRYGHTDAERAGGRARGAGVGAWRC